MSSIQIMDLQVLHILLECLRTRRDKDLVVLPPDRQHRDARVSQVLLEVGIQRDVRPVVQEEVQLYFLVARALQQRAVEVVALGRDAVGVRRALDVLPLGHAEVERGTAQHLAVLGALGIPVRLDGRPEVGAQALGVGVAVLRHDGRDGSWAGERQAPGDGRAVVEDIHREALDLEGVEEGGGGEGQVGECVFVVALGGHVGEAVAWEVGGDDAVAGGEEGDEVAEHVRGGGEAVQEEEDGGGWGAGGAVEDVDAICLDGGDLCCGRCGCHVGLWAGRIVQLGFGDVGCSGEWLTVNDNAPPLQTTGGFLYIHHVPSYHASSYHVPQPAY
jgi:hypothetical protein